MRFPLAYEDIRLWIAVVAIILLSTSELLSAYYGHTNLYVDRKRLRRISVLLGSLFLLSFLVQLLNVFL